ncbi:MAG: 8-oxo-dGTP diphosphatase [Thermoplasmata archaeon]|nr:8-oxo-dGTP diphosphatase [Thermoplasmata archaeon]
MKLATLCYVRKGGRTLMIHRVKKENDIHEGKWNGLGGKLEPGEMPEECAVREVKEESGLDVKDPVLKGILTFPEFANGEDWYVFVYVFNGCRGEIRESSEGVLEWIENDRLLDLNLWEGDRIFLPLLDEPGVFSGKFHYVDGRLMDYHLVRHTE